MPPLLLLVVLFIFIFVLCIVFILGSYSPGLLLIAEPYVLMGLPWCWDCYLFLNKGVIRFLSLLAPEERKLLFLVQYIATRVPLLKSTHNVAT